MTRNPGSRLWKWNVFRDVDYGSICKSCIVTTPLVETTTPIFVRIYSFIFPFLNIKKKLLNAPGVNGRPAQEVDLTAVCKPIIQEMWEPGRPTTLRASTACYKNSFNFSTFLFCYVNMDKKVIENTAGKTVQDIKWQILWSRLSIRLLGTVRYTRSNRKSATFGNRLVSEVLDIASSTVCGADSYEISKVNDTDSNVWIYFRGV
jgi:hypothetical protein